MTTSYTVTEFTLFQTLLFESTTVEDRKFALQIQSQLIDDYGLDVELEQSVDKAYIEGKISGNYRLQLPNGEVVEKLWEEKTILSPALLKNVIPPLGRAFARALGRELKPIAGKTFLTSEAWTVDKKAISELLKAAFNDKAVIMYLNAKRDTHNALIKEHEDEGWTLVVAFSTVHSTELLFYKA